MRRYVVVATAFIAVAVVNGVAMLANYRYGYLQGTSQPIEIVSGITITSATLNAWLSVAFDVIKGVIPIFILIAWKRRYRLFAAGMSAIFILCMGWSIQAAIGYVQSDIVANSDAKIKTASQWDALSNDIKAAENSRQWVPEHRPLGSVDADIETQKLKRQWKATNGCQASDISSPLERRFCEQLSALNIERAAAAEAAKIDERISRLRDELNRARYASSSSSSSSHMFILAETQSFGMIKGIHLAILIEAITAFGMVIIFNMPALMLAGESLRVENDTAKDRDVEHSQPPKLTLISNDSRCEDRREDRQKDKRDGITVADWSQIFLVRDGGTIKCADARSAYISMSGVEISAVHFGRLMAAAGIKSAYKSNVGYYSGYSLNKSIAHIDRRKCI